MKQPNSIDSAFDEAPAAAEDSSFGDILSQFEQKQHDKAEAPGQPVEGTIIVVRDDFVFVDIGRKTEGLIPIERLRDESGQPSVQPGDKILVTLTGRNQEGYYELSTIRVERPKDFSALQSAFEEGRVIAGTVTEVVKGGLRVDIGAKAFMPASRSGVREVADLPKLVGQEIRCKLTKADIEKEDFVVDRRVVLEQEEKQAREAAFGSIQEGQVVRGTVKTQMDIGAFVDIGGVDGLLHVTDMSWTRVNKPSDLVKTGDSIEVKVLKVNPETRKISLGMKQLQPDPWSLAVTKYKVGDRIHGTVARLTDFGAFVNLEPGIDGLVHISEMSWSKKLRKPSDLVNLGDAVEVVVLGVNPGEKRISLGLKQTLGDPWEEAERKYPIGSIVEGPITNMTNFGAFVDLGSGVEGMIHVGDVTNERRLDHPKDLLKAGQVVRAQMLEFDREKRRIRLGMKQLEPTSADTFIAEHQPGETVTGRVVEVKNDRAKVELGEGVFATCKLGSESEQESKSSSGDKADIGTLTAMLSARWKQGGGQESQKALAKAGQIRQFKIRSLDPEQKKIQVDLVP
ncbi:MAG TPA: 30S ribosomal protein S1 [Bryobacteraceae bacterium]|nr:30S ribosomal protein S1 [Bryobacteraceae bacterium]